MNIKDMKINIGLSKMMVIGKQKGLKIFLVGTDNFNNGEKIKMEVFAGKPRYLSDFFEDAVSRNAELVTYKRLYLICFVAIFRQPPLPEQ